MSSFLGKFIKVCPRFEGTEEERAANVASHDFRTVYLKDRFPEMYDLTVSVVECTRCKLLKRGINGLRDDAVAYPCGAAPDEVPLEDYVK